MATIRAHEEDFLRRAVSAWHEHPAIEVLGNLDAERLSIVSFVIRRPGGRYLHHNLVVSILNDLFGIQSRGGCSCAGPYGHRLLGIDLERSHEFEREIAGGCEGIKPGWVRINFNYFVSEPVFEYVVRAVALVADHGHKLAPAVPLRPGHRPLAAPRRPGRTPAAPHLALLRRRRRAHLPARTRHRARDRAGRPPRRGRRAVRVAARRHREEGVGDRVSADFEHLRWFDLPAVCLDPAEQQTRRQPVDGSAIRCGRPVDRAPQTAATSRLQRRPHQRAERGVRLRGPAVHQVRARGGSLAGQEHPVAGPRVADDLGAQAGGAAPIHDRSAKSHEGQSRSSPPATSSTSPEIRSTGMRAAGTRSAYVSRLCSYMPTNSAGSVSGSQSSSYGTNEQRLAGAGPRRPLRPFARQRRPHHVTGRDRHDRVDLDVPRGQQQPGLGAPAVPSTTSRSHRSCSRASGSSNDSSGTRSTASPNQRYDAAVAPNPASTRQRSCSTRPLEPESTSTPVGPSPATNPPRTRVSSRGSPRRTGCRSASR